ncbi:protein YgfX [Pokkaliibacter plantistimulans]|uniref:protein YgfX n=1 Tax=Pokkaliibacter plantistimulans TaxID=1635171 RepID=UPI001057792A|nr:protein YgfX [Pokkaliibacter plantistimulans]
MSGFSQHSLPLMASRQRVVFLIITLVMAIYGIWQSGLEFWQQALLSLAVFAMAGWEWRYAARLPVAMRWREQFWWLGQGQGRWQVITPVRVWMMPWVIVLDYRDELLRRRSLLLFRDSLQGDDWRRLQVRLRYQKL